MSVPTTNAEFLAEVFGPLPHDERPWVTAFTDNPMTAPGSAWSGFPPAMGVGGPGMNWYCTQTTYRGPRSSANAVRAFGVMLDDIGTKCPWPTLPPSYAVETSRGNFQLGYLFAEPVSDLAPVEALQRAIRAAGFSDPGAGGPSTRYGRLPFGLNTKHTPPFVCRLAVWAPELRYTTEQIAEGLGLAIGAPATPADDEDHGAGPCPEWRGPPDTDEGNAELIRRALASRSAGAMFEGDGVGFADLWHARADVLARRWSASGRPDGCSYERSSADLSLATRLGFWTGKHRDRMARLMRQSGLNRDKYGRPDYLARTISKACSLTREVLGQRRGTESPAQPHGGPVAPVSTTWPPLPPGAVPAGPLVAAAAGADMPTLMELPAPNGDDGLAHVFAGGVSGRMRWSPGLGWMVQAGPVWKRDDELSRYEAARRVCRGFAQGEPTDSERRRLTSAKTVQAVLTLAQADPRIVTPASAWDADPLVLNTPGGLFDLRTGQQCDPAGHLVTHCANVAPDFAAAAPVFDHFMSAVFLGRVELIAFVQRLLGYVLTGSTREQVLAFFYGSGANGKSTLVDFFMWLAGSYALKLPAYALMAQRNGEQHPTGIAQLRGKRLAVSSELEEGQFFNESLIKELTGDATMTARFMRGDFFQFPQTQKHLIVGNFKPRLRGGDPALARRILLVPFDAEFRTAQRDPDMLQKLKAEGPAVLAWLVRGAVQWHADGLGIPQCVRDASADYMAAHDDLQQWAEERCERKGETKASDLYADFRRWKELRGEHAPTQTTWGERLQRLPGVEKRKSNGVRYSPLSLKVPTWSAA